MSSNGRQLKKSRHFPSVPEGAGEKFLQQISFFLLTSGPWFSIISKPSRERDIPGSIAQLVEHMPYKHGVTGSSPVVPTTLTPIPPGLPGSVVQLVRTPACHAGGRGFKSLPSRHFFFFIRRMRQRSLPSRHFFIRRMGQRSLPSRHLFIRRMGQRSLPSRHFFIRRMGQRSLPSRHFFFFIRRMRQRSLPSFHLPL